jgi:hypothetical protein
MNEMGKNSSVLSEHPMRFEPHILLCFDDPKSDTAYCTGRVYYDLVEAYADIFRLKLYESHRNVHAIPWTEQIKNNPHITNKPIEE